MLPILLLPNAFSLFGLIFYFSAKNDVPEFFQQADFLQSKITLQNPRLSF